MCVQWPSFQARLKAGQLSANESARPPRHPPGRAETTGSGGEVNGPIEIKFRLAEIESGAQMELPEVEKIITIIIQKD